MFFSVYTFGCKLNQLETEALADSFLREGFTLLPWGAPESELMLLNTCTVTSMADQKARRVIRKALREHPEACLVVTGCYAQMEREALAALENEDCFGKDDSAVPRAGGSARRLYVVSGEKKDRILRLPRFLAEAGATFPEFRPLSPLSYLLDSWFNSAEFSASKGDNSFLFKPVNFSSHSRAFLKIQDGCDNSCAYCRVSLARGKSRSLVANEALRELDSLEKQGFAEVVLTGVNITQYRDCETALPGLLDFLLRGTEKIRIRLSSIEPDTFLDSLSKNKFAGVLENDRIRPHFHLSVQSGSEKILRKMGRSYTAADVENAAALLRSVKKDPFLACDIIAGFPGEGEVEFEKTASLCESIGFSWIHAFPFSPRPGTAAFDFPEKVSGKEASGRVKRLTFLAEKGRQEYIQRHQDKELEAIVEAGKGLPYGFAAAVSENYLKLFMKRKDGELAVPGSLVRCRITHNGVPAGFDAFAEEL